MPARTLLHVFSTFTTGGPQIRFAALANHFGRAYRHLVVAMDGVTTAKQLVAREIELELLPILTERGNTWRNLREIAKTLARVQPDLLITSNWGAIEWAIANLLRSVRHLHLEDGFGPEEAERQFARRIWTRRLVLRRSTVVVPSRRLFDIALKVWRVPKKHLLYLPNGIDCGRFNRHPDPIFAARLGIRDDDLPVIGTVARLGPEKNLHRLIDAFAGVLLERPAVLAIVGDGPERAALSAHAAALGIERSVVFTGTCSNPERLLPSFSIFAISSDTEQMPLSVLEAMAAGRAVVATDVGDIREMLAPENHPFVVQRDATILGTALRALLADERRASSIGRANAHRARALFDQEVMFTKYRALFDGNRPVRSTATRAA